MTQPTSADQVVEYLNRQSLCINRDALVEWKVRTERRLQNAWKNLNEPWRAAFRVRGPGAITNKNGYLDQDSNVFNHLVADALRELADDDDNPPRIDPSTCRNSLSPLGIWAGCQHDLHRCRELFRAAELARLGRQESTKARYATMNGFRSWAPDLKVYRSQDFRLFRPKPGYEFLNCRVRELPLRALFAMASKRMTSNGTDGLSFLGDRVLLNYSRPQDDWGYTPEYDESGLVLPDFDCYAWYAAILASRRATPGWSIVEASEQEVAQTGIFMERVRSGELQAENTIREVRAILDTLAYGLPNVFRLRLMKSEYGVDLSEVTLSHSEQLLEPNVSTLEDQFAPDHIERASLALGLNPDMVYTCLIGLVAPPSQLAIEERDLVVKEKGWLTQEAWDQLSTLSATGRGEKSESWQVRATLHRNLLSDLRSGKRGLVMQLFEQLLEIENDRDAVAAMRGVVKEAMCSAGTSLAGRPTKPEFPSAVRRDEYLLSQEDVMLTIAGALIDNGHPLTAIAGSELLLEVPSGSLDIPTVRALMESAFRMTPGFEPWAGPVEVSRVACW